MPPPANFDGLQLARMRQDRRTHSVAVPQPRSASHSRSPLPTAARQVPIRPSAAVPRASLHRTTTPRRAQTIRFTEPTFKKARTRRLSSATTAAGTGQSSIAASKRGDSLVPPKKLSSQSQAQTPRRKSTAASLFGTRSWSIFYDPRIRATSGEEPSDTPSSSADAESGANGDDKSGKRQSFAARCKSDRLLHVVLGMVVLVGAALIISGLVWSETHQTRVMEDKRDFVCGKGIAGGPKCRVHLKGEKTNMASADWVGGEVVDWWLKNHCVWKGKEGEWWCGSEIGQKEGQEDQVLPDGTYLERVEEEEEDQGKPGA